MVCIGLLSSLVRPDAALSPRRATYCSFASPKESRQRKGDPGVCVPALRCGQPPVLTPSGVPLELASLRQSRALFRLPLRSSAHSQGLGEEVGIGFGIGFTNEFGSVGLMCRYYFHSCSRSYYLDQRPKSLRNWQCGWVLGVRSRFRCAAPAGRAEGVANSGSDPQNARIRFRLRL